MRERRAFTIDMTEIDRNYVITEDGMVYSLRRKKWLKPRINVYGYVFYSVSLECGVIGSFAHTLVALKYIGRPPSSGHEIDHLDENKMNNHYSNLMWRTHSENIMMSFKRGRRGYWNGKNKPSPELSTRMLMANAKKKGVVYENSCTSQMWGSIQEAADELGMNRRSVYNYIKQGKPYKDGYLRIVEDNCPILGTSTKNQD